MTKYTKHLLSILMLLVLFVTAGCGGAPGGAPSGKDGASGKYKVALVLVGPISDGGWNASTYEGMQAMAKEMEIEFAYSEAVPLAEGQATIRDYASRGYQLVIANNFGYSDAAMKVAKDFPDVKFAVLTGRVSAPNLSSYDAGQREGTFLAGALAALMTKSGKIGVVGGVDMPSIIKAVEGFKAGARHINPTVQISTAYTGTFADVAKAKEAALAQISAGADIVAHVANQAGLGVLQAAKEKNVYALGTGIDQHAVAPKNVLSTALTDMTVLLRMVITDAKSGSYGNKVVMPGLKEGVAGLAPFYELDSAVPAEVKQRLEQLTEEIKSGKLVVPESETKSE